METTFEDLKKQLSTGDWPSVLLIAGDDAEARTRALDFIVSQLPSSEQATSISRHAEAALATILDDARTASLFGNRRIVIAVEPPGFEGAGESEKKAWTEYLNAPGEQASLVLLKKKLDRRLAVTKAIVKRGALLVCERPKEREMPRWIEARAKARGLRIASAGIQLLADAVGTDTAVAAREIEKLKLLVADAESDDARGVDAQLVADALGPGRAVGAFELEDAMLNGRPTEALDALERMLIDGDGGLPLALLGRLASIARRLAGAHAVLATGGNERDVEAALKCHPFVAGKYHRAARRVGTRAARGLAACVSADVQLKSGRDPRHALAGVVLAMTAKPQASASRMQARGHHSSTGKAP